MKKLRSILALALTLTSLIGATACSEKDKDGAGKGKAKTVTINTFDDYDACFAAEWSQTFGKAAVNTDKTYVSEGNGSMLVEAYGAWNSENEYPYVEYDFPIQYGIESLAEYSDLKLDVYNTKTTDSEIRLVLSVYNSLGLEISLPAYSYTLAPGWNEVSYAFNDAFKQAYYGLSNVKKLTFEFPDYVHTRDGKPVTLYLDNLRATKGKVGKEYDPLGKDGMLLDFEDENDRYFLHQTLQAFVCDVEICKDNVTQGKNACRVIGERVRCDWEGWSPYPSVKVTLKADALPSKKFPTGTKLQFDIFNEFPNIETLRVELYYADGTRETKTYLDVLQPYAWCAAEVEVEDMAEVEYFTIDVVKEGHSVDFDVHTFILDNIRVGG